MTLARRLATPGGGLLVLALGATIVFFAIITAVETCSECGVPSAGSPKTDLIGMGTDAPPTPARPAGKVSPASTARRPSSPSSAPAPAGSSATTADARPAPAGSSTASPAPAASAEHPSSSASAPAGSSIARPAPANASAPAAPAHATDVGGAAAYVRGFYADLTKRDFTAAWPRLAADLRAEHRTLSAWRSGFATTVRQSTSAITARAAGPRAAVVTLTLTAVDRDACGKDVERHFAVSWRLRLAGGRWRAEHAAARPLGTSPVALAATCRK